MADPFQKTIETLEAMNMPLQMHKSQEFNNRGEVNVL